MTDFIVARDVVVVEGADARRFLHGQLSQDIEGMGRLDSRWSFLLQPTGKVVALVRVTLPIAEHYLIDVEPGLGAAVRDRLQRFLIRTKATISLHEGAYVWDTTINDQLAAVTAWWGTGSAGVLVTGVAPGSSAAYEQARVEAGWPANGAELDESTIPAESGVVAVAASFTKGCYTGQELVERIDSRGGNVPRRVRRLRFGSGADGALVRAGASVRRGDQVVGRVTSVAGDQALAVLARAVDPGDDVEVGLGPDDPASTAMVAARVEATGSTE